VPASNPAGSPQAALAQSTPKFRTLLDIINLKAADVPKNVVGTIFAPSDAVSVRCLAPICTIYCSGC
jgi:hypothetical protein